MKPTKKQRDYWSKVAAINCIITAQPATIAHCHGGSMLYLPPEFRPGVAQRQNHWLVIPLDPELHQGQWGLDTHPDGVTAWEKYWRTTQIELLTIVGTRLGVDVWGLAGIGPEIVRKAQAVATAAQ